MNEIKEKLIKNLKGYSFEELKILLKLQKNPEVRGTIMDAMERYYEDKFLTWMEEY